MLSAKKTEVSARYLASRRAPLHCSSFPAILFWSQKSACTVVVTWFFHHVGVLAEALAHSPWIHNYENNVFKKKHLYTQSVVEALLCDKKTVVKCVRNPFRRTVSCYLSLAEGITLQPKHHGHGAWQEIRHFFYGNPNADRGISFRQFTRWLAFKGVDPDQVNGHFAAQRLEGEEAFVSHLVRAESLAEDLRELERMLALPPAPTGILQRTAHSKAYGKSEQPFTDVEVYERARLELPSWHLFYDDETEDTVRNLFLGDFELYGYECKVPIR